MVNYSECTDADGVKWVTLSGVRMGEFTLERDPIEPITVKRGKGLFMWHVEAPFGGGWTATADVMFKRRAIDVAEQHQRARLAALREWQEIKVED